VESNRNITKRDDLNPGGSMAINVESGGFRRIEQTLFDKLLDSRTIDPGAYTFEKMISGRYLGSLGSIIMLEAVKEGLFSKTAAAKIVQMEAPGNPADWQPLGNKDLDDFCGGAPCDGNPLLDEAFDDQDRALVKALCTPVYERSAILAAINIASAILKTGAGSDADSPVCVNVDGSTYYKTLTLDFAHRVRAELDGLLQKRGIAYDLVKVAESPVIGAAIAGLMM
jgi:hexokinase